ncbi:MAG TPA: bifunctional phosphopantothenoylcysteine decarboxylase/phosphopantothenate--cysteine ligase CoaBC [Chitinivibrionales bacterium]|nr:bifunctional phosphopantothenoylcysteine decarboxylase/phosphopantothenate--cysteine ligase CoaBC [Chitinivibrionales bacterium]
MEPVQRIVLGITGGIAAYKMPQLLRLLSKNGISAKVVLTQSARPLVGEEALRVVSGNPVYCEDVPAGHDMAHIELAKWGQLLLVCPATANTIAKIANGIADNLLTTLALSFEHRTIIAPAMNTAMWNNRATQDNIAALRARGCTVLPVDEGELACGDEGPGRLLPLETIVERVRGAGRPRPLAGKKVLISSGPTSEALDAVRVISNRSSGKMGAALAAAALSAGADVCVVSGPAVAPLPAGCRVVRVFTALEMKAALEKEFRSCDICIMAAAVGDFRPKEVVQGKKHRSGAASWTVELLPNPDIAEGLGKKKKRQILVGFSLETKADEVAARVKMKKKNCDMMVVNAVESAMEADAASAAIIYKNKPAQHLPRADKRELAEKIMASIITLMGPSHG